MHPTTATGGLSVLYAPLVAARPSGNLGGAQGVLHMKRLFTLVMFLMAVVNIFNRVSYMFLVVRWPISRRWPVGERLLFLMSLLRLDRVKIVGQVVVLLQNTVHIKLEVNKFLR